MIVIGLTGPSGAGKGEVARLFCAHGIPVLDADAIYHELLLPPSACLDAIIERFGTAVKDADGALNRAALGSIVFSDPDALEALNRISHRFVMEEISRRLEQLQKEACPAAVLDAPQLFEAGAEHLCDPVIAVLSSEQIRLARIMARDGISEERARARIFAQKSDAFFREHADIIIENNGDLDALCKKTEEILAGLSEVSP